MKPYPLIARLSLLAVLVSALFTAPAIWGESTPTSVEIIDVRTFVAAWCEEGEYLEVDVRVRLARRAQNRSGSEDASWLDVEHRVAGTWEREEWPICAYGYQEFTLPGGTEVVWTERIELDPAAVRESRFVLDVERPRRFGFPAGRLFAASEPFRPSELLARFEAEPMRTPDR